MRPESVRIGDVGARLTELVAREVDKVDRLSRDNPDTPVPESTASLLLTLTKVLTSLHEAADGGTLERVSDAPLAHGPDDA